MILVIYTKLFKQISKYGIHHEHKVFSSLSVLLIFISLAEFQSMPVILYTLGVILYWILFDPLRKLCIQVWPRQILFRVHTTVCAI